MKRLAKVAEDVRRLLLVVNVVDTLKVGGMLLFRSVVVLMLRWTVVWYIELGLVVLRSDDRLPSVSFIVFELC